jgi:hypothetical protein
MPHVALAKCATAAISSSTHFELQKNTLALVRLLLLSSERQNEQSKTADDSDEGKTGAALITD